MLKACFDEVAASFGIRSGCVRDFLVEIDKIFRGDIRWFSGSLK